MFKEKNGQEGTVARAAYTEIAKLGYDYDSRFIGEFEKCPLDWAVAGPRAGDKYHEFMLPVRKARIVATGAPGGGRPAKKRNGRAA